MTAESDSVQTVTRRYDPALLAEASGFTEVVQPARILSLEPLHLDLADLSEEGMSPEPEPEPETNPELKLEKPAPRAEPTPSEPAHIPLYEGTLVLPASALPLPPQDRTLVLPEPPARALEHTLVIAVTRPSVFPSTEGAGDAGAETRIVPLEAWAPAAAGTAEPRPALEAQQERPVPAASGGLASKWRALPVPRRISLLLAPFALLAVLKMMLVPPRPLEQAADTAPPPATTERTLQPARPTTAPMSTAPAAQSASARLPNGKSLQRAAADAMAEGNAAAALALYKKLAAAEPHVPAYRAAARILEERVGAE